MNSSSRSTTSRLYRSLVEMMNGHGVKAFELRLPGEPPLLVGEGGQPSFTIACNDDASQDAILRNDEIGIANAYIRGGLEFSGDMLELFKLRNALTDRHWFFRLWSVYIYPLLRGQIKSDREWIARHYDFDHDFYLAFLDREFHAYSQGPRRRQAQVIRGMCGEPRAQAAA